MGMIRRTHGCLTQVLPVMGVIVWDKVCKNAVLNSHLHFAPFVYQHMFLPNEVRPRLLRANGPPH